MRLVGLLEVRTMSWCGLRFIAAGCALWMAAAGAGAQAPSAWDQPADALAGQIAEVLGPGPARLTIRNLSTISNDEIPAIRALMEKDLKAHGVTAGGDENANAIRVTLSENARERLWVAEIVEGNESKVAMVEAGSAHPSAESAPARYSVTLKDETVWRDLELELPGVGPLRRSEVLAAMEWNQGLALVDEDEVSYSTYDLGRWHRWKHAAIPRKGPQSRDPRSLMVVSSDGRGFDAYVGASVCSGTVDAGSATSEMKIQCGASDDPWPIVGAPGGSASPPQLKAFYNASRDYFTGVVTPSLGVDLPPFYSAAMIPRAMGAWALVIGGIDGKVQVAENGTLKAVSGTRDWGSDFAVMRSGCGGGTQIMASGAGGAAGGDSLRAYEIPAADATAVSAPLSVNGTVMALETAADGKSVYAVVKVNGAAGAGESFEVDRVTASCN